MLTVYGKLVKDYYEWCILEFFSCKVGSARQGRNVSPLLLSVHINGLEYFL